MTRWSCQHWSDLNKGWPPATDKRYPRTGFYWTIWDFLHLIEDYRSDPVVWRSIQVPGPWQAQFAELRMRGGTGIYRRQFEIPAGWKRRRIFLKFGAVFHITRAWVN